MRDSPSKFTWDIDSPAPFESSWMIFAKIMILNYLKPHLVWDVITAHPSNEKKDKRLLLHHSEWINFERFSAALGVRSNRLRKGFLDQLGFTARYSDIANGIRLCPECLAKGYHCSYFNLSLIDACPWHGVKLLPACKECAQAMFFGLTCEIGKEQYGDPDCTSSGAELIYRSKCGHLSHLPQVSKPLNGFSIEEESGVNVACNSFMQWWYTINISQHSYAPFARKLFSNWVRDEELEKCLAIANDIAGPCPWPLKIACMRAGRCEWRQTKVRESTEDHEKKQQDYYRTIYKSVRRHIFRRFIRQHRGCVAKLLRLKDYEEHYLISSTVCSLALAYVSWRVHMERNSFVQKKRSPFPINTDMRIGVHDFELIRNPKSLAHLWFIQFFLVLDSIERLIDKESFDIHRWDVALFGQPYIATYEFIPDGDSRSPKACNGRWLALYPEADSLIGKGRRRCAVKLERECITPDMYTIGSLSLLNYRPDWSAMFRIINLSEQRKNFAESYAYEENYYS